MSINIITLLISFSANLFLAIFIYLHNPKSEINRVFSGLLFCTVVWIFGFLMLLYVKDPAWLLFFRRLTPAGAALIASFFFDFVLIFPRRERPISDRVRFLFYLPGTLIAFLSIFTSLIVKGYVIEDVFFPLPATPIFGPFYKLFAAHFLLYFLFSLVYLTYKFLKLTGNEKNQAGYVLFGIATAGLGGTVLSLILPLLGINALFSVGPVFTFILAIFVTYAIIKHHLLDIKDFLSSSFLFFWATFLFIGILVLEIAGKQQFIFPYFTFLSLFCLGLGVLFKDFKNVINRAFFVFVSFAALWAVSTYLVDDPSFQGTALFWMRLTYAIGSLLPLSLVYFAIYFPEAQTLEHGYMKFPPFALLAVPPLAVVVLSLFGDLIVKEIYLIPGKGHGIVFGTFSLLFPIILLFYLIYGFFILLRKEHKFSGLYKMQIRYIFLGIFSAAAPAVVTNVVLPLFDNFSLAFLGPSFSLIFVGFAAYAIVRHRLMGLEFVLQRGVIYSLLSVFAMFVYGLVLFFVGQVMVVPEGANLFMIVGFSSVILAISFQPILRWLENVTDRLFFRGHYDYQRTIQEVSQAITSVIKLEEIVRLVVTTFVETLKVKEISFLLLDRARGRFKSLSLEVGEKGSQYKIIEMDERSPIVKWLKTRKDVLVKDELERTLTGEVEEELRGIFKEVYEELERLEIAVWTPIISRGEIIGLIALGEKLSGDVFTTEDITLLKTLANQIAVGIENTALYEEVLAVKNYTEDILMSMVNGVITTDLAGSIITFNYTSEKLTGLKAKEVVGRGVKEVFGERAILVQVVESTLKDRCYSNFETELGLARGAKTAVSISSTLLRDNHGRRMGVLISLADLSEVKDLEGKVRRADKLAALGTMAAGMAHEIKNPLSSIKVLTQLLPLKFAEEEYRAKFSEIMPKEIERIDRIVESLLGFARAASPKFEKIRIEAVVADTLEYYKNKIKENGITLVQEVEEVPMIVADFGQLSQVFSNLILNAIQAMPTGGTLKVKIGRGKRTAEGVDTVVVEISDTGRGIEKESLSKLFDPFFTTKYGGTGLGLTISHSIVSGHKGFIDVKSEIGKGTLFTVTLPLRQ